MYDVSPVAQVASFRGFFDMSHSAATVRKLSQMSTTTLHRCDISMTASHSTHGTQILDGQAVSDNDRSSATVYASTQTERTKAVTTEAISSVPASHGLPGSLPSSSQPGNRLNKGSMRFVACVATRPSFDVCLGWHRAVSRLLWLIVFQTKIRLRKHVCMIRSSSSPKRGLRGLDIYVSI